MRKEDFLEILKDYLKNSFSQDEIADILRDYEEYFIDGAIEGKTEMEIISGLGSPKEIAAELLAESNTNNKNDKSKIARKVDDLYIVFKNKSKSMLNKFKVNLNDKNHAKSRKKIEFIQILLTLILLPIAFSIFMTTFGFALGLIGSVLGAIVGAPFAISLISVIPEVKTVVIFGVIAYIGLEILLWQLFIAIFKLEKRAVKMYMTWLKTNQLYINGSIKKEEKEQNGGGLDE